MQNHSNNLTSSEIKYGIDPDRDFDMNNVASSTDLTGLIPFAPDSKSENESYGSLIEYQAEDVTVPKVSDMPNIVS